MYRVALHNTITNVEFRLPVVPSIRGHSRVHPAAGNEGPLRVDHHNPVDGPVR